MSDRAVAQLDELGVPLAGDHEQRRRARHDQEPRRDRHADGDTARNRAQHESRSDTREVENGFVLQPQAVHHRLQQVTADDERQRPAGHERQADRRDDQDDAAHDGRAHRDLTRRDRPEALRRVAPVGFDIERVVDEVGAARGEAEADEHDRGAEEGRGLSQHAGGAGRGDDEHVLHPLLRPREADQSRETAMHRPRGRLWRRNLFGSRHVTSVARSRGFRARSPRRDHRSSRHPCASVASRTAPSMLLRSHHR